MPTAGAFTLEAVTVAGELAKCDDLPASIKDQVVKLMLGAAGVDGGLLSNPTPVPIQQPTGSTGTRTQTTSTVEAEILAANASRRGAVVQNDADKDFYLGEGTTVVTSS